LITQFEITTSIESAGSGISSITLWQMHVRNTRVRDVAPAEREHLVGQTRP
jgi:hypothetical protein